MWGALVYGFFLGTMGAFAITAAILFKGPWIGVALGAGLFLLSDAIMGETTIKGIHPANEFQIPWMTYLAAQALLLYTMTAV